MWLVLDLAIRDLFRERLHLICNTAVLVGIIVPLLVLFGVKNGVYDTLLGRLLNNPATLQIDTMGNNSFTPKDAAEIRTWPESGFVTLKTRSQFDFINIRAVGGRRIKSAILSPSGLGDPTLPEGLNLGANGVAISAALSDQLGLAIGAEVQLITQASNRPRQLVLPATVRTIIPAGRMSGRAILADIAVLDLVEAFYDEYALPTHEITDGRPLDDRVPSFEGLRVYATDLAGLGNLQNRIETRFGIGTQARTREVESVLGLGRNLDIALLLTTLVAAVGLGATLIFSFWAEVARKRHVIASLALIGIPDRHLWVFPVSQAFFTATIGLICSFTFFAFCAKLAETMFDAGLTDAGGLVRLSLLNIISITIGVLVFVTIASLFAARAAQRIDPAIVLREAV